MAADNKKAKRPYQTPQLEKFGTVADLTQQGNTNPGGDMFQGSAGPSQPGPP